MSKKGTAQPRPAPPRSVVVQPNELSDELLSERELHGPWRLSWSDWRDVLWRVRHELENDQLAVVAAGVAFFMLLAAVPLLALLVSVYGLVADPALVEEQVGVLSAIIPSAAWTILEARLAALAAEPGSVLGIGFAIGLAGSLWATSSGALMIIRGVNIAYDEEETRSFLALRWLALKLTLAIVAFGVIALASVALLPLVMHAMGLHSAQQQLVRLVRWPLMLVVALLGLAIVYRLAPNRTRPRWRWVSVGSFVATLLWLLGSVGFSLYVDLAGRYDETYGSLGGLVVFMLWLYVSALSVLVGAEINAEIEHQTSIDSTIGPERPMGERGALMADTLGRGRRPRAGWLEWLRRPWATARDERPSGGVR